MKEWFNRHKREIWVGVIVSLITGAIMKIGDWFVSIVPTVGSSIFETLSNTLYSLAATHTDNLLLRLILLGGFSFIVGSVAKQMVDGLKVYKKIKLLEKKSKKLPPETITQIEQEVAQEMREGSKRRETETIQETIVEGKKTGKRTISLVAVIAFAYFFITFFVTTPMSLSNAFHQDIVKIAPYTDDSTIEKLNSDWLCMRSKAEYDAIYKQIDVIKDEYNLP